MTSSFHFLFFLEDEVDRLNNRFALVDLAMHDDVKSFFDRRHVNRVFLDKSVVQTAVPDSEEVSIPPGRCSRVGRKLAFEHQYSLSNPHRFSTRLERTPPLPRRELCSFQEFEFI